MSRAYRAAPRHGEVTWMTYPKSGARLVVKLPPLGRSVKIHGSLARQENETPHAGTEALGGGS